MADDYLQQMLDKEKYLQPLTRRMDDDTALLNITDRVLRDAADNPARIPNSIFVPLNDLQIYMSVVKSFLGDAEEQVTVESEDENLDTAEIESFIKAFWREVDNRWRRGDGTGGKQWTFSPFIYEQTLERGRVVVPSLCRIENKQLVADLRAWDSRWTAVQPGEWIGYKMTRDLPRLLKEYPQIRGKVPDRTELLTVRNILTPEEEIVFVEELEVLRIPHKFDGLPGVTEIVPLGSMRADADSLKYEGESALALFRDIFPQLMIYVSTIQSLNLKELDHALFERVDQQDMDANEPVEHDQLTNPRAVTKTTGGFFTVPLGELKAMAESLRQMLESRMERAGLNNFDTGTFTQQMSGVALLAVGKGRIRTLAPRLDTHGLAKKDLTEMAIQQILKDAERKGIRQLKVGRQTYDLAVLKEEYDIDFSYKITDATMDVARQSLAVSQRGLIPQESILRDTLQREDWQGDIRALRLEQAEVLFPNIKRKRIIMAAAEAAEKGDDDAALERDMMLDELGLTLDQLHSGQLPPVASPVEEKPQQPMVPLFEGDRMQRAGV